MTAVPSQPTTLVTPEDLLRMPDANTLELVDGRLVEKKVSAESSAVGLTIGRLLSVEAARTGQAKCYGGDLGYQCFSDAPNKIRKPDISVIRKERLREIERDPGFMPIAPDLAVEVVSPNELARELAEKVAEYQGAGVPLIWVVYPAQKMAMVLRLDGSAALLNEKQEITAEPALPSFRCVVGEFFL